MKALVCEEFGPPESLKLKECPDPEPQPGDVRIRIAACGLNFPDLLMIEDKYQFKPGLPFIPGGEVAGVVDMLGKGVDSVEIGQPVVAVTRTGGFAEYVTCPASRVLPFAAKIDLNQAAALVFAHGTSLHALQDRAAIKPGETLLVMGAAGGVGLAAVELGNILGARVIAAASSQEKCDLARHMGASETVVYPAGALDRSAQKAFSDQIKSLTGGSGVDVIYDPVGGDYTEPAVRALAWGGRYLVIGFAAGPIPALPLNLVLLKQCQIIGVFWGAWADRNPEQNRGNIETLMSWVVSGRIKHHVSAVYSLEEGTKALRKMADRSVTGKVLVAPAGDG